ncbi:MAG: serine hydrolase domain-containing protein, partial [Planctomycetaceae bacterium]
RDLETREALAADALFRIYSMTKPVTCAGALLLAERGLLDLDAPVERWLPELADRQVWREGGPVPARRSITPRDLLRHTAGLTYGPYGNTPVDQLYTRARLLAPDQTLADLLLKLRSLPLISHPGETFQYGVATDVVGRLIEVIDGRPLDQFLQDELFLPLGLRDTGFAVPAGQLPRLVTKYSYADDLGLRPLERAEQSTLSQPPRLVLGGAGLVSTIDDYARFCQMLLAGGRWGERRVLRGETVAHMTANQLVGSAYPVKVTATPWAGVGYGLGVSVVCERLSADSGVPVGEYGWSGSASTHFWSSPHDDLFVIVMAQVIPFTLQLEWALKPLVYQAVRDRGPVPGPWLG